MSRRGRVAGGWGRRARAGKFNAVPTYVDNVRFHSGKEAARYQELKLLLKAGKIFDLELQPKFPLVVNGVKIGTYIGDFKYWVGKRKEELVVEDVKGVITPAYRLKRELMKAIYLIWIKET